MTCMGSLVPAGTAQYAPVQGNIVNVEMGFILVKLLTCSGEYQ